MGGENSFGLVLSCALSAQTPVEEYWPDMEGLEHREAVTDFGLPEGTFFDCALVHLPTATLDRLRELYPWKQRLRRQLQKFSRQMRWASLCSHGGAVTRESVPRQHRECLEWVGSAYWPS